LGALTALMPRPLQPDQAESFGRNSLRLFLLMLLMIAAFVGVTIPIALILNTILAGSVTVESCGLAAFLFVRIAVSRFILVQ
ncbi:MAG: hypothetical protein ACHQ50_02280, partial [Fimbriimonadales bacterium]